ncbi:hypothetical protein [Lysinibacillus sp. FJAT-14222]|nr:hypothetical protein [Lysinibacillus sp. FJAT-14222]KOS62688.1 hypothetical protein AN161_10195 [Lysinibacillus sp. FJAT-14222]
MRPWNEADRGMKAKSITSCDNAFMTNLVLARRPQEALRESEASAAMFYLCESEATATMFYLRESEASAAMFYLCESEATATMFYLCESEATATMF